MKTILPHVALALLLACSCWPVSQGCAAEEAAQDAPAKGAAEKVAPKIEVDEEARTVAVPATVARLKVSDVVSGAVAYVLVGKGGRSDESLFWTESTADELNAALERIGLKAGTAAAADKPPEGPPVAILAEYRAGGRAVRRPVDELVVHVKSGKPLEARPWPFTGSAKSRDPETGKEVLQASLTQSLVGLYCADASPLFQNPRPECREKDVYRANAKELPPPGAAARLIFQSVPPKTAEGMRRVHVFVSGRVQGVGFRNFTQREARRLKLTGFVRNLADGRVEAVVEGPRDAVAELLKAVGRGPDGSRVGKVDVTDEQVEGKFADFEVLR